MSVAGELCRGSICADDEDGMLRNTPRQLPLWAEHRPPPPGLEVYVWMPGEPRIVPTKQGPDAESWGNDSDDLTCDRDGKRLRPFSMGTITDDVSRVMTSSLKYVGTVYCPYCICPQS